MKKLFAATVAVALIAFACWLILASRDANKRSAWVKLPDGNSIRIVGVTYGTNHILGSNFAKVTARMPVAVQEFMESAFGKYARPLQTAITSAPELVVWVEQKNTNAVVSMNAAPVGFHAYLGDRSNFTSGSEAYFPMVNLPYESLSFPAFPRRDREIMLNIYSRDQTGKVFFCTNIPFANPLFRKYPVWQPETLPATRRVGDLDVTLLGLETGHDNSSSASYRADGTAEVIYGTNRLDGENNTAVMLKLKPVANTKELWEASPLEVSDATGNIVHNFGISHNGYSIFSFSSGFWPGEAAWKLKLVLKRTQGFKPGEIFVFKNVPLGEPNRTNLVGWTTNFGSLPITLQSVCRRAPQGQNEWNSSKESEVVFTHPDLPPGAVIDLVGMVCDTGVTNYSTSSGVFSQNGTVHRNYGFRDVPLEAKTADFNFAVQSVRTVEFTVKPELPKTKLEKGR